MTIEVDEVDDEEEVDDVGLVWLTEALATPTTTKLTMASAAATVTMASRAEREKRRSTRKSSLLDDELPARCGQDTSDRGPTSIRMSVAPIHNQVHESFRVDIRGIPVAVDAAP